MAAGDGGEERQFSFVPLSSSSPADSTSETPGFIFSPSSRLLLSYHPFPAASLVTIVSWLEVHSGLQTSLSASLLSFQNPFSLQKPEQSWTNISDCVMLSHLPPACLRQRKASSGFPVKPKLLPLCDGWLYVSVGSGKKIALPFQSVEGLNTTKGRGGRKSPLLFLPHCLSWDSSCHLLLSLDWDSHHQLSWFSDLLTWTERHLQLSWVSRKPADLFL